MSKKYYYITVPKYKFWFIKIGKKRIRQYYAYTYVITALNDKGETIPNSKIKTGKLKTVKWL